MQISTLMVWFSVKERMNQAQPTVQVSLPKQPCIWDDQVDSHGHTLRLQLIQSGTSESSGVECLTATLIDTLQNCNGRAILLWVMWKR